jgi:membrane protein YdbS with pleckstrin-like domain
VAAALPLGVAALLALRLLPRRHAAWRFALGEEALLVHRGVLVRVESVIPYSRIQHVDYTQGPLARLHRLASVVVRTASADGGTVRIPGLSPEEAVALREALAARAGMVEPL